MLGFLLVACGDDQEKNAPTADTTPKIRVTVSEGLVFARPSREAEIIFRLLEGDISPIIAQTDPDDLGVRWYQVGQNALSGWIAGSQVEVSGNLDALVQVSLANEPVIPLPTLTETPGLPTATPTPEPGENAVAIVKVGEAVIFEQPSRAARQTTRLFESESANIIGRTAADSQGDTYYFLARNGFVMGWVLTSQVTVTGDIESVPTITDAFASVMPTEAGQVITVSPESILTSTAATQVIATQTIATQFASPTAQTTTLRSTTLPTNTPRVSTTPSGTPDLASTSQAAPTATNFPTETIVASETPPSGMRPGVPPPLEITLPAEWQTAHVLIPITSAYLEGDLSVTFYRGPLPGGVTGSIWLIWGFPNIVSATGEINLYSDGVQLLRSIVLDPNICTIGINSNERRIFMIGGREATGAIYSASPCADNSDIAGFFAVLQVEGGNFAFFTGIEPVQFASAGLREMQPLLDSIIFTIPEE